MNEFIDQLRNGRLQAYRHSLGDIQEHYGIEQTVLAGGYGYRQVLELVQNGADAILEAHESGLPQAEPRIEVSLVDIRLYVANTGASLSKEGIDALLRSHSSPKRGNQIGRFGLGFKSLLRLGGKIDLFSTSVAMRFDPDRCRRELREQFHVEEAPGLRLAWTLDEAVEKERDAKLNDFPWATTVVRAEIEQVDSGGDILEHLRVEIQGFPAEFLLFLPVPVLLRLAWNGQERELRCTPREHSDEIVLHDGPDKSRWRVTEEQVHITDAKARGDATDIHARDVVPLSWAMPLDIKRKEAGRFWAFFPTHTATYLPGILNAPWKLNSDRNAIIHGEWNDALMREAARMIGDCLPALSTSEDPGRPLDAFPRQFGKDEVAEPLVKALWAALENAEVVPDAAGTLRVASDLRRHPRQNPDLAEQWRKLASGETLKALVHPSCLRGNRASRLGALAKRLDTPEGEVQSSPILRGMEARDWFKAVASCEHPKAIEVLKLAEAYANDCKPGEWGKDRPTLPIIPCCNGQLKTAEKVVIAPKGLTIPGRAVIAALVSGNQEAKRIVVDIMGVKELDTSLWMRLLADALAKAERAWMPNRDSDWRDFWNTLRAAPATVRKTFIDHNGNRIRLHRRDGEWVSADELLFPGRLVTADDVEGANTNMLVDQEEHAEDESLLTTLGVSDLPQGVLGPDSYSRIVCSEQQRLLSEWLTDCRRLFRNALTERHSNPHGYHLKPLSLCVPRGWALLAKLTGIPNATLSAKMLELINEDPFRTRVEFGHSTRREKYPIVEVPHPLSWFVLQHGSVRVGHSAIPLPAIVAKRSEPVLARLPEWSELQPAIDRLAEVHPSIEPSSGAVTALWRALIDTLATPSALANDELHDLWAGAAREGVVPDVLPSSGGDVALENIFVTGSPDLAQRAREQGYLVVTLDDATLKLWVERGATNLGDVITAKWSEELGPRDLVKSAVPELHDVARKEVRDEAQCQLVSDLSLCVGGTSEPVPCMLQDNVLFLDTGQLAALSRSKRLEILVHEIAPAGWLAHGPAQAIRILGDAKVEELRAKVAAAATLPERLHVAVGGRLEPLRAALGDLADKDFVQARTSIQLAELVLAQLGPATLSALKETLEEEGLKPPGRWNTAEARTFVASIGFPVEYAASPVTRREAEDSISGPIPLGKLHDFQTEVFEGLSKLVGAGTGRRRAVVSLPTGGGKTRVTAQAAVDLVLKPERANRRVIWVAQTDELCEQAVQAFRQVWINRGVENTDLRIIRLWGGNPNPGLQDSGKPIVVIASIQTLNSRMRQVGLHWLKNAGLVVVDECHHAITKSYTNLLRWLDAQAPRPGAPERDEPPIIGLSATPFRTDEEESGRLARRFDSRWLPADQAGLHTRLRAQGALAHVDHEALKSPAMLPEAEIENLRKLGDKWEGIDFENILERINQHLAGDAERNEILIDCIQSSSERSILFFANSVVHAAEMAARLQLGGIPAAAVSGRTSAVARRYFLDAFQRGDVRVLCNHTVLSTGFDAPKTDMVLIARQVFSPVRYMQMVGRGMRGQANGGTARCRLVTVVDNLGRFQDQHPYHFCAKYFSESTPAD